MSFEENLELILSQGLPTKVVLQAIHDGLLYLGESAGDNNMRVEELRQLMLLIREDAMEVEPSGAEVTEASVGYTSLKARIDDLFNKLALIDAKIESVQPVMVSRSKTEIIPIVTNYEYNNTLAPSQSYVKQAGKAGVTTVSWDEEQVSGVPTGRVFNETVVITTAMIPKIEVKGTKVIATKPIRYVRVRSKRAGANVANLNEIEVYVQNTNIARNATVSGSHAVSNPAYAIDGARNLLTTSVTGVNPYVQVDLKAGYHTLTRIFVLLAQTVKYDYVQVHTSTDGNTWYHIMEATNYKENGNGIDLPIDIVYGSLATYVDRAVDIPIGGNYTIVKSPIRLYYSSDRAFARNISQGNPAYTGRGTHKVLNKRTANGVIVYGLGVGWVRSDENV